MPSRGSRLVAAVLVVASIAMLGWHARQLQFFCDDSYISYRFSQNFADGHGLVYNAGERVEGFTNFLWVVLLGGALKLGFAAEPASLWLGVAFLVAALALTALEGRRLFRNLAFALVPVALLVCQGPMVLWSISGLESSCFAAMTLAAIVVFERGLAARSWKSLALAGALYAVSTMVRPDGVVFGAAAGIALVLRGLILPREAGPIHWKGLVTGCCALAAGFVALFAPFVLWRHSYYGDWLPNTFYVKAGGIVNAELGVAYFAAWLRDYPLVAALTLAGVAASLTLKRWRSLRGSFAHYALAILLFCVYVGWAGGDYMALYRFVMPLLPLSALFATVPLIEAFERAAQFRPHRMLRPLLTAAGLVLLAGAGYALWLPSQRSLAGGESAKRLQTVSGMRRNSAWWVLAGKTIHDVLPPDITIATTAAGALPYFAGQRCIDQSGLCDRYTAKEDSDPWMLDRVGHQKQATRKHLAELKPEAIFWHPVLERVEKAPAMRTPTPDYELRALRVAGLEEDGRFLWFWARRDVLEAWKSRGVLTKEEAANVVRAERASGGGSGGGGAKSATPNGAAPNAPQRPMATTADFTVPKLASGAFLTRRLHEVDPTAEEVRASVDDVTRPLWTAASTASGSGEITLSGAAGSAIEFELASAGSETVLPGVRAPQRVELGFERAGTSTALPLLAMPPLSNGPRAWKRYRADASGVKGDGRLALTVDGVAAGRGGQFLASVPRVLDAVDEPARRNILIVTVDTLRADYLGCYGHDRPTSPNLDALAKSGVLFDRCVSQSSWTLPSYSAIFTGLHCESHGVVRRDNRLGSAQVTFVEEFAKAGYATGGIVSGTFTDTHWGFDQGFDDYDDLGMIYDDLGRVLDENGQKGGGAAGGVHALDPATMKALAHEKITSPEVAQKAMHWLDAHRDRRFCLFVHFFDPHESFLPHPGISEKFPPRPVGADFPNPGAAGDRETDKLRALYEGEIAFTDEWIGKLLDHVRALGLWDETIVVLCADHGQEFKERGNDDKRNVAHGSSLFNEQVRVPLIVRVPGVAPASVPFPVANLDLGPTLLELTQVHPGEEWRAQGQSLAPMLAGSAAKRDEPVLSSLFQMVVPNTKPEVRVKVWSRIDQGDLAAIEYAPPGRPPKRFLFDWAKDACQTFAKDLAPSLGARLTQMFDYYGRRAAGFQEMNKADQADASESQAEKLKKLGYAEDKSIAPEDQTPAPPDQDADPASGHDAPTDPKNDPPKKEGEKKSGGR